MKIILGSITKNIALMNRVINLLQRIWGIIDSRIKYQLFYFCWCENSLSINFALRGEEWSAEVDVLLPNVRYDLLRDSGNTMLISLFGNDNGFTRRLEGDDFPLCCEPAKSKKAKVIKFTEYSLGTTDLQSS
jgi:hypothetical protein